MVGILCGILAFFIYTEGENSCANGCSEPAKTITLSSATFYYGSRSLYFSLNNPGSQTTMSSATVSGITCAGSVNVKSDAITTSSCTLTSGNFTNGELVNYEINFANGQSVGGALNAQ
jgi:hypothetical protein